MTKEMENNKVIAVFESKQIRRYFDRSKEVWYFSLVDIDLLNGSNTFGFLFHSLLCQRTVEFDV